MSGGNTEDRVSAVESIIPRPPDDIAPMRAAFARMVSKQWQIYVPPAVAHIVRVTNAVPKLGTTTANFTHSRHWERNLLLNP